MVKRLGVLSRLLTPSKPATFCSTIVPETGRFQIDQRAGMSGIGAEHADMLLGGLDIDFGFVFGVLRGFEIFGGDGAAVVEHLRAIERFVREHFVGLRLFDSPTWRVAKSGLEITSSVCPFFTLIAESYLEVDDAACHRARSRGWCGSRRERRCRWR